MTRRKGPSGRFLGVAVAALVAAFVVACGGGDGSGAAATFLKSYGGSLHDEARTVVRTADGGFMLFGTADGDDCAGVPICLRPAPSPAGIGTPCPGRTISPARARRGRARGSR